MGGSGGSVSVAAVSLILMLALIMVIEEIRHSGATSAAESFRTMLEDAAEKGQSFFFAFFFRFYF